MDNRNFFRVPSFGYPCDADDVLFLDSAAALSVKLREFAFAVKKKENRWREYSYRVIFLYLFYCAVSLLDKKKQII